MTNSCFALIVCYHPDPVVLGELIECLSPQVLGVLVLNNGGMPDELKGRLSQVSNLSLIDFNGNVGIPVALNTGFEKAIEAQANWVVTFDQDSRPSPTHVATLISAWNKLKAAGANVGAIGPLFIDDRDSNIRYPFYKSSGVMISRITEPSVSGCAPTDVLITSGMLVSTSVWQSNLRYCDALFVDFVDTEWCLRAVSRGFNLFGCFDAVMRHRPSDSAPKQLPGILLFKYSPIRRYYYFRNSLWVLKMPHISKAFKFRIALGSGIRIFTSPFVDEKFMPSLKAVLKGLWHGVLYSADTFKRF